MKKFYIEAFDIQGRLLLTAIPEPSIWYCTNYKTSNEYKSLISPGMYKSFGYFKIREARTRLVVETVFKSLKKEI